MTPANAAPQPHSPGAPSRWWHAADIIVVLFAVFWFVGWAPQFIQLETGDEAFTYAFHYFHGQLAWGTEIFQNSAGPWGIFYYSQYFPDTFLLTLAGQSAIAVVVALTVLRMFAHLDSRFVGFLGAVASLTFLSLSDVPDSRFIFLAMAALLLTPDFSKKRFEWLHGLILIALALGFLIKGTYLAVFVLVWGFTLASELSARRIPLTSLAAALALLALDYAAGQSIADLLAYAISTLDPVAGYPERFGEVGSIASLGVFLVFGLALWLLILAGELGRFGTKWGLVTSLVYAAIMFGLYKQSFVRQDGDHVVRAFLALLPFSACYVAVRLPQLRAIVWPALDSLLRGPNVLGLRRPTFLALVGMIIGGAAFFATHNLTTWAGEKTAIIAKRSNSIVALLTGDTQLYRERHEREIERVRNQIALPPLEGTVAVYSHLQTLAIAHGLDLRPIPTSTPYVAMTPRSEGANKRYFEGSSAPDYVIMGDSDRSRQPTGLALLANYEPYYVVEHGLVLKKSDPEEVVTTPYAEATFGWGDILSLPDSSGAPIWARIHYQRSLLNRIVGFFYQPAPVTLELFRGEQMVYAVRLVQALAAEGMIISPNFDSIATFAALDLRQGRRYLVDQPVTSMRLVVGENSNWLYPRGRSNQYVEPEITVEFMRIEFPGAGREADPGLESMQALTRLLHLQPSDSATPRILATESGAALAAEAAKPLRVAIPDGARAVRVEYGVRSDDGAAAQFSLIRDTGEAGSQELLWSENIGGGHGVRGAATIDLPAGSRPASLILAAEIGDGSTGFWSDVRFIK